MIFSYHGAHMEKPKQIGYQITINNCKINSPCPENIRTDYISVVAAYSMAPGATSGPFY